MNFQEAYKAMQEGKNVRRKSWKKNEFIDFNHNDKFVFTSIENALAEDWEVVEEKKKYWRPEEKEKYFYIEDCMGVSDDINVQAPIDYCRFNTGNCFKTKIEAEHMLEKIKVIHELKKFAYDNNEGEIEWSNICYYLYYDHLSGNIEISENICFQILPFNIYFTSRKIALKAIETIGADRIKKYYFDVEE